MGASQFFVKMKGRRRGEGVEKTKGDPLAMPSLRTTPLSQTWPQLLQPLGFTRRTIIWDAPLLLPPCKSLDHRISCTHRLKTKAAADHLCTLTNAYCLPEQPQLQDHNAAAPDATLCAHPQNFFRESKVTHEFTRQFAPIRATLILSARTDRIQSRASHEFMQRFAPLCACAPPAATTRVAFTQPPVCRDDGAQPRNPTDSGN